MSGSVQQHGEFGDEAGNASPDERFPGLIWTLRACGIAAALTVWYLLGRVEGLGSDARIVAAVATLMAIWWTTEAIPLTMPAFKP